VDEQPLSEEERDREMALALQRQLNLQEQQQGQGQIIQAAGVINYSFLFFLEYVCSNFFLDTSF